MPEPPQGVAGLQERVQEPTLLTGCLTRATVPDQPDTNCVRVPAGSGRHLRLARYRRKGEEEGGRDQRSSEEAAPLPGCQS